MLNSLTKSAFKMISLVEETAKSNRKPVLCSNQIANEISSHHIKQSRICMCIVTFFAIFTHFIYVCMYACVYRGVFMHAHKVVQTRVIGIYRQRQLPSKLD